MKRVRLNDLGRRRFPKRADRLGDYLGEHRQQYHPSKFQFPESRVLWDGTNRYVPVLNSYLEFFDSADE